MRVFGSYFVENDTLMLRVSVLPLVIARPPPKLVAHGFGGGASSANAVRAVKRVPRKMQVKRMAEHASKSRARYATPRLTAKTPAAAAIIICGITGTRNRDSASLPEASPMK